MSTHTPGPWKVYRNEYPHYLGKNHVERVIGTERHDAQLQAPWPIVTLATGIGKERGGECYRFVSIDENDAQLMAAAPQLLLDLQRIVDAMPDAILRVNSQGAAFPSGLVQLAEQAAATLAALAAKEVV